MVKVYDFIGENANNFAFFDDSMAIAIVAIMKRYDDHVQEEKPFNLS